jgi:hypothetical protein
MQSKIGGAGFGADRAFALRGLGGRHFGAGIAEP